MILSFAKTTEEYEAGLKTCTRRRWKQRHYEKWRNAYLRGDLIHQAWSNLPFVDGARRLGDFRLTCFPYFERLDDMPEEDLIAEGGDVRVA